jgi:hypothetical protein
VIDRAVDELHRCIVEELSQRGHDPAHPLTIVDLYEDIAPYRAVRARIGVELNADYEHALLRLLAGEGGLLRVAEDAARQELEREVFEPFPDVGLFRKFSGSEVRVRIDARPFDRTAAEETPTGEAPAGAASEEGAGPEDRMVEKERAPEGWTVDESMAERSPEGSGVAARADRCASCHGELPAGRDARFCPSCGRDQRSRACPGCSEALEADWRFCIRCGHRAAGT